MVGLNECVAANAAVWLRVPDCCCSSIVDLSLLKAVNPGESLFIYVVFHCCLQWGSEPVRLTEHFAACFLHDTCNQPDLPCVEFKALTAPTAQPVFSWHPQQHRLIYQMLFVACVA